MDKINQVILQLRADEKKTYKEISDILKRDHKIILSEDTISSRYLRMKKKGLLLTNPVTSSIDKPLSGILTEADLRNKHDMYFIIHRHVQKIPVGKFLEENQMLKDLGFYGKPRSKDAVSRPELKQYRGKVDGTVYFGHPESIRKLKQEGVLQ
jgi:hypothetical protein